VLHEARSYDQMQGQGHGRPKVAKMVDFKVSKIKSAPPPGCIKRLVADHETGQYLHFFWKDF